MDEIELIREAKKGNRYALNQLLANNYNIIKGYVIKMAGDASLAQDITQETMIKAVLNINKFEPEAKFSTWMIRIATNVYRDYLRKNRHTEELDEKLYSREQGPEEKTIENMEYKEVLDILQRMPYEKRAVFILKHYNGYKYEEIAKILNCPVGTVRSRLHNCIKTIMEEMERRKMI